MKLTDFDALSFDCYGTLIDWEAGLSAVLVPWARERGLAMTTEELLTEYASIEAAVEAEHPARLYPDVLAQSMAQLGMKLHAEVTGEDAARLAGSVPDWPAFPDSRDALVALSERFSLIILSNVDRASFAASSTWLGATFASVITAQDVGSYKPAQANFDALTAEAARLGIGPGGLLHVAQSLFHDHLPAKQAGLPTVWINRRHNRPGWGATPEPPAPVTPDWEFPSMADFAAAAGSG
ncbi:MAG TPA: HAD-IA family hydrolase [Streptosporangiaceae bacterium]|jgi:2-haloacid dehalogenase|nr:HAD-IA family hydrolase [Streptosporangiaceae bacterium]